VLNDSTRGSGVGQAELSDAAGSAAGGWLIFRG
jgi:hypothetical protein